MKKYIILTFIYFLTVNSAETQYFSVGLKAGFGKSKWLESDTKPDPFFSGYDEKSFNIGLSGNMLFQSPYFDFGTDLFYDRREPGIGYLTLSCFPELGYGEALRIYGLLGPYISIILNNKHDLNKAEMGFTFGIRLEMAADNNLTFFFDYSNMVGLSKIASDTWYSPGGAAYQVYWRYACYYFNIGFRKILVKE
jgi:hypothetical protein